MSYKYRSRRSSRKLARKSRTNFIISLCLIAFLVYATLTWILPFLINGVGSVKGTLSPAKKVVVESSKNSTLAPPVLNISYEATNTAQINIRGYGTTNSKVAIFLDDEKKDTADVSEDGTFEFKNIRLVIGTNNIYGKSIDEKNQESLPSKTLRIIYDNEKPKLSISEPQDNKKIQGGDKKIKIAGNTQINAQIFINGSQIIVDKDGNFSSDQTLNEGDNDFNIKAIDQAGNSTEMSRKITYQP